MTHLIPRYHQIAAWIHGEIRSGALAPGHRIPTERELGERFGAARETVRHATALLRAQGLIEVRRGQGTYVVAPQHTTLRLAPGDRATAPGTLTVVRASGQVERYPHATTIEC